MLCKGGPVTGSAAAVALISTGRHAHLDEDLPLLVAALEQVGVSAAVVDWHDDEHDWAAHDLAVIRSPWDYVEHHDAFVATLERIAAATTLANPLDVVKANLDKHYLAALAGAGVPVVPTTVLDPGDDIDLPSDGEVVVKPTVSAGARDTERYPPDEHDGAVEHARRLLEAGRSVLVQPYVASVDEAGETGLVHLGDRFSHAFRKGPILRPDARFVESLYREEEISRREPSADELEVAETVLDAVPAIAPGRTRADLLYARVDLVAGPDGPMLMELELVEPSLFLTTDPGSPHRAAAAIAEALARVTS